MDKKYLYLFLFLLVLPLINAEIILVKPPTGYITNVSALNVNHSNYWDNLDYPNTTQHENNNGVLSIKESWLTTFGNNFWCSIFGCTMEGNITANYFNGSFIGDGSQLTGLLKLDQTSPQTIINGVPLLDTTPNGGADLKSFVNKEYVDLAVTSLGAAYYMYNETDATGYKTCYLNPSGDAETYIEVAGLNDNDYIGGWISAPDEEPQKLLKGIYDWYLTAEKTTGTETLRVYWQLIERKSDTSEVVIATSSNSNELNGKLSYIVPLQLTEDYIPDSGSRIVGKLYADVSGSGNAPTIRIYYQGDTSSRWEIPANSEIFQNIFVPYNGAVQDVDLGDKNITSSNFLGNLSWNYLDDYPVACLEGYAITQLGDEVICSAYGDASYQFGNNNFNGSGNITTIGTIFSNYFGSLINRITTLFVQDININGTISNSDSDYIEVDDGMNITGNTIINGNLTIISGGIRKHQYGEGDYWVEELSEV